MADIQKEQDFDYFVVLDFEACWDERGPSVAEIIEWPGVLVNAKTLEFESEFRHFVKPTAIKKLHPLTTEATGITQEQVDGGLTFKEGIEQYHLWLVQHGLVSADGKLLKKFAFVTCGDWDLGKMLPLQANRESVERRAYLHQNGWINIKHTFDEHYVDLASGMAYMLKKLRMELLGRHHSGIDDCRNIARILKRMVEDGAKFKISSYKFPTKAELIAYEKRQKDRKGGPSGTGSRPAKK